LPLYTPDIVSLIDVFLQYNGPGGKVLSK
jgi:hypothetical protein